jgi:hypothetical protein
MGKSKLVQNLEPEMRVDLCVPFSQKDLAKSKGARWDAARKTWYVVDPLDIRAFALWMGRDVKDWYGGKRVKPSKKLKPKNQPKVHAPKPVITGPAVFVPLCNCTTPPWEDCEHTDALAQGAMAEMLA